MNFQPLFTMARVMRASYQIITIALLMAALARRGDERPGMRAERRLRRLDVDV
jgi:hypothetical protein